MIGGVTRHVLPHLSGVPHLSVNYPYQAVTDRIYCGNNTSYHLQLLEGLLKLKKQFLKKEVFIRFDSHKENE